MDDQTRDLSDGEYGDPPACGGCFEAECKVCMAEWAAFLEAIAEGPPPVPMGANEYGGPSDDGFMPF